MEDLINHIKDFKITNDFNYLFSLYKKKINNISKKFRIEEYEDILIINFWQLIKKMEVKNFNYNQQVDLYINKSLNNFAINIYRRYFFNKKVIFNNNLVNLQLDTYKFYEKGFESLESHFYFFIKNLNYIEKEIIILRYEKELSDNEIAKILNVSRQYVFKLRKLALEKLKQELILINYIGEVV